MLTLYHAKRSTCSQKVRLCLTEKGLGWDSKLIDISQNDNLSAHYLNINPDGVVPALVNEQTIITESNVINEYLDDLYPEVSLKPESNELRAYMRMACQWAAELHHPCLRMLTHFANPNQSSASHPAEALDEEAKAHPMASRKSLLWAARDGQCNGDLALYEVKRVLNKLELLMAKAKHPFLLTEHYSLADAAWTPTFNRLEELGLLDALLEGPGSSLALWWQLIKSRESFQTAISDW